MQDDATCVQPSAVLEQIDALPGAEHHPAGCNGDPKRHIGQRSRARLQQWLSEYSFGTTRYARALYVTLEHYPTKLNRSSGVILHHG